MRRRRRSGFHIGWRARQRWLWGTIGFLIGGAAAMFVLLPVDAGGSSLLSEVTSGGVAGEPRQRSDSGGCSSETGEVVRNVEDRNGKVWPIHKYEFKMDVGGATMSESRCSVSGSASPTRPQYGFAYFVDTESGARVFTTSAKIDGKWILYGQLWQD